MLVWSAEHATEITMEQVELEIAPNVPNVERRAPNLEFVLQEMHTALAALTKLGGDCGNRYDQKKRRKETKLASYHHIFT